MADFEGSLPIKSVRDNDVVIRIADWASGAEASTGWSVDALGAGLVRAVDLDIRSLTFEGDKVDVSGSIVEVSNIVAVSAVEFDIRKLTFADDAINVTGSSVEVSNTVTVSADALDIRSLVFDTDKVDASGSQVGITDGTNSLNINSDGSLNVALTSGDGADVLESFESVGVAKNAVVNFDYAVPNAEAFKGKNILVGSRGAVKVQFGTFDGTTFAISGTYFQLPAQNGTIDIPALNVMGDGSKNVRIAVTNLDNETAIYATLQGRVTA